MDQLTDLAVFIQVAESRSFTAAAHKLGMAKSVVSKYVTRLEDRLGVRLLHRTTRRLSLTEAGERLHQRGARALEDIEEAERDVSSHQEQPRGRLRVAAPMSLGLLHLAPALPAFLREHPLVKVDLRLDDRPEDVIGGGIDVALRIAELADSSLIARRLCTIRFVTVASSEYLRSHGTPQHPAELSRHSCLVYTVRQQANLWRYRDASGREIVVSVEGALQANNSLALREALVAGIGIALTPSFVVGEELRDGRLVSVLNDYGVHPRELYAILPERKHLTPKTRAFVEFAAKLFCDPPAWDGVPKVSRARSTSKRVTRKR
jgi:DNA-binding transcriptional LysR family regulator